MSEKEQYSQREILRRIEEKMEDLSSIVSTTNQNVAVLMKSQEYNDKNFQRMEEHMANEGKNKWMERVVNIGSSIAASLGIHIGIK